MELAPIAPISLLETQADCKYQLMLPQLTSNEKYVQAMYDFRERGDYIIFDNGAAEAQQASDLDLVELAVKFGVSELAVPDVLADAAATVARLNLFMDEHHSHLDSVRLGFVAQGKSMVDSLWVISKVLEGKWGRYFSTVYLPRLLLKETKHLYVRVELANIIKNTYRNRLDIHLFGASPLWGREVQAAAKEAPHIRSMDTSMPYNYTFHKASMVSSPSIWDSVRQMPGTRPDNYFSLGANNFDPELLQYNMSVYRMWANGTSA